MWVKFIHNVCESKSCPNDNADSKDKHKINTRRHAQWYGWDHILIPVNFVCLIMRTWDKDSFHCIQYGITLEIIISIIFLIQIVLWGTYEYLDVDIIMVYIVWLWVSFQMFVSVFPHDKSLYKLDYVAIFTYLIASGYE